MFSQLRQKYKIRARGYCYDNGPQSERRRKAVDRQERVIAGTCDEGTNGNISMRKTFIVLLGLIAYLVFLITF